MSRSSVLSRKNNGSILASKAAGIPVIDDLTRTDNKRNSHLVEMDSHINNQNSQGFQQFQSSSMQFGPGHGPGQSGAADFANSIQGSHNLAPKMLPRHMNQWQGIQDMKAMKNFFDVRYV